MKDPGDLAERFLEHVLARRLFPKPGKAVVAVSGGPDSLALLTLMREAAPRLGLALIVAHVDHGIQETSGQVARLLGDDVRTLGIPFELGELHLGPDATETEAREARYAWLQAVRSRQGARYVVTAHHADDQVETILLRVLRGSAPTGLAGIKAKSRAGLVRPLLPFSKSEIERLPTPGLTPIQDPSNSDPRHLRSWVRTTLLPVIEERMGGKVREDLLGLARHASRDARAWDALPELLPELDLRSTRDSFSVARLPLAGYDAPVAAALLRAAARRIDVPLGPRHALRLYELAKRQSGRRVELGGGWVGEAVFDRLVVGRVPDTPQAAITMKEAGTAIFGEYRLAWRAERAPARIERAGWTTWVAEAEGGLIIRTPQAGDRMAPLGGVGRREVRRLLMEARVPRAARAGYPLLTYETIIVWVPGICRGEARVPQPGTPAVRLDVTEYDQA